MQCGIITWVICLCSAALCQASSYLLVQEDFIKLGKKELYQEQVQKIQGKQVDAFKERSAPFISIGMEDLENPRMLFFTPVQDLASLDLYPPFTERTQEILFNTCLNFQIFSLYRQLFSENKPIAFPASKPYYCYVVYDVTPSGQSIFEEALIKAISSQESAPFLGAWKSLFAGAEPSYMLYFSFETKEQLKEWSVESFLDVGAFKEILRSKKQGWMKQEEKISKH
jgi:hypothetical protein